MIENRKLDLMGLDASEIAALVKQTGEPGYRVQQLLEGVYRQRVSSIEEILTLPQQLRAGFSEQGVTVGLPGIEKSFV